LLLEDLDRAVYRIRLLGFTHPKQTSPSAHIAFVPKTLRLRSPGPFSPPRWSTIAPLQEGFA